jgi:signal transduction histidine kinase
MSFLKARLEYAIAGLAFGVFALVVPWWSVLARRLVFENAALTEQLKAFGASSGEFGPDAERFYFMLTAEFASMFAALAMAIASLVYIARQRSLAQHRMERLLQFTTHELKTPIAGVRALLQSLGLGSLPEARKAEFLKRGLREVDRLEHLTETILAWQRSLAWSGSLAPSAHDATSLVNQILEHRSRTALDELLEVRALAQAKVLVDPDAFRVILENLLDNAHKYGGGRAEVVTELKGPHWVLSIRDHGQGFVSAQAENLFDPFRRQSHDGVTHGSGLGLYLSRQLALRMRARLTASSDGPGLGAVFSIALPVSTEGAPPNA